jgi:hypothetical protein
MFMFIVFALSCPRRQPARRFRLGQSPKKPTGEMLIVVPSGAPEAVACPNSV